MASHYGVESRTITEPLETFKSVKRRLEVKAEVKGVTIIDDFAHHPTAISETLRALRTRYKGPLLWPPCLSHAATHFAQESPEGPRQQVVAIADEVAVASIFKSEAIPPPPPPTPSSPS